MLVLEKREPLEAPAEQATRARRPVGVLPLPALVPQAEPPAAHRPDTNIGLARISTPEWNSPHGQAMRAVEATLALGVMAYFAAGLLGVLGIL